MVYEIYSNRLAASRRTADRTYQFDDLPEMTRQQIVHLWKRTLGNGILRNNSYNKYCAICDILREEYGTTHLSPPNVRKVGIEELSEFFVYLATPVQCLDVIELCMNMTERTGGDHAELDISSTIDTLNARLRSASFGFQYESGQIVKVDQQIMHSEIVKPALIFLSEKGFEGPNAEYLSAHKHFRSSEYEACLVECLKAFESTMKVICASREWPVGGDTASKLIAAIFDNGLLPDFMQSQFGALRALLEGSVPTTRNKMAGHGRGEKQRDVPEHLASFVLHQTAATILFLAKAAKAP